MLAIKTILYPTEEHFYIQESLDQQGYWYGYLYEEQAHCSLICRDAVIKIESRRLLRKLMDDRGWRSKTFLANYKEGL